MIKKVKEVHRIYCLKCGDSHGFIGMDNNDSKVSLTLEQAIIEAEHWGWRKINNRWECPKCSGNLQRLEHFFGPSSEWKSDEH